ncbi:MAG: HD domain-containing protein [Treponema sp.]|nr:HD domain-containing protein [Treponema sp.]
MLKKGYDKRINDRYATIKVSIRIFFLSLVSIGLFMWLYENDIFDNIFEKTKQVGKYGLLIHITVFSTLTTFVFEIFRHRVRLPIEKLSNAAREITNGNLSVRVSYLRKDGRKDVVSVLFDDFNNMTKELEYVNNNLQMLVNEKTEKIIKLQNAILKTMADLVEFRDNITGEHIERTKNGVKILLKEVIERKLFTEIISKWDINLIVQSTQLHDIGKISIDDQILRKQGSLTKEEFEKMKKHTTYGHNIIKRIEADSGESDLLNYAKIFALNHHEKWNRTGYPSGLSGDNIPLEGRIMAIIDVYDALVSERPYKRVFSHEEAIKIIKEGKNTQFDPVLTDVFISINEKYK